MPPAISPGIIAKRERKWRIFGLGLGVRLKSFSSVAPFHSFARRFFRVSREGFEGSYKFTITSHPRAEIPGRISPRFSTAGRSKRRRHRVRPSPPRSRSGHAPFAATKQFRPRGFKNLPCFPACCVVSQALPSIRVTSRSLAVQNSAATPLRLPITRLQSISSFSGVPGEHADGFERKRG